LRQGIKIKGKSKRQTPPGRRFMNMRDDIISHINKSGVKGVDMATAYQEKKGLVGRRRLP